MKKQRGGDGGWMSGITNLFGFGSSTDSSGKEDDKTTYDYLMGSFGFNVDKEDSPTKVETPVKEESPTKVDTPPKEDEKTLPKEESPVKEGDKEGEKKEESKTQEGGRRRKKGRNTKRKNSKRKHRKTKHKKT